MDTLLSMKVFCQVVQSGSFTRAAQLLGISIPMASKHVAHLEKSIGTQLLYRNNRTLKVTEQGEQYFRECLMALEILEQAADQANAGMQPRGTLRISVPIWFACDKFAAWINEYQQRYPQVEIVLSLTNRHVDLNSDGEDMALRLSNSLSENLIAKRLGEIPFYLVAAPSYIQQHFMPHTPEQLIELNSILPTYTDLSHESIQSKSAQLASNLHLAGKSRSDNTLMIAALIRAGSGIGYMPSWLADSDIEQGRLIRLLPDYELRMPPLYAVYAGRRSMNARLRSFIDFLSEKCAV